MTQIVGAFVESATSGPTHTVTVPAGVTTGMTALLVVGTGSSTAVTITPTSSGATFTKLDEQNAGTTRVAIITGTGLAAGATITLTLTGGSATLIAQHQYTDDYTYGTLAAAIRSASSNTTVSGSTTPAVGQRVMVIALERTTTATTVSSVTSSGGETVTQTVYGEGATVQTSAYLGSFVASAAAARTATITYSNSSANGYCALLPTTMTASGTTPGAFLNVGVGDGQYHMELQAAPDGATDVQYISPEDIAAGYTSTPNFKMNAAGTAVQMRVSVGAVHTSGSLYPRTEFREHDLAGNRMAFDPFTGRHYLRGKTKITHLPPVKPEVIFGQLHNGSKDAISLRTQLISGQIKVLARIDGTQVVRFVENYTVGTEFEWMIECLNGTQRLYFNDMTTPVYTGSVMQSTGSASFYFKAGCYSQSNTDYDVATEYVAVEVRQPWQHWHTGWPDPTTTPPPTAPTGLGALGQAAFSGAVTLSGGAAVGGNNRRGLHIALL